MKKVENYQLRCVQPIFFQKFHFAFNFYFSSGTDFQLIYRGALIKLYSDTVKTNCIVYIGLDQCIILVNHRVII